jgi:hypothetical protein
MKWTGDASIQSSTVGLGRTLRWETIHGLEGVTTSTIDDESIEIGVGEACACHAVRSTVSESGPPIGTAPGYLYRDSDTTISPVGSRSGGRPTTRAKIKLASKSTIRGAISNTMLTGSVPGRTIATTAMITYA